MPWTTNDDVIRYLIKLGVLDAMGGRKLSMQAKAGNYTIVTGTDPSGTLYTNRGAGATITFTLPTPSPAIAGVYYDFATVVAQIITVQTAAIDTFIVDNDALAKALSTTARIGVTMRAMCDGTSWIGTMTASIPAAAFAQTGTVTA